MTSSLKLSTFLAFARTAVFSLLLLPTLDAANDANPEDKSEFKWQTLSTNNFTSQIHLHPHILLFITVPWCGESRSLMNEISQKLAKEQQKFSSLKLMLVNRNLEKMLSDSFAASEGTTVVCYNHAVSYKYRGILRAQDILSSANYLMLHAAEDLPLKRLGNANDLEMFFASTDKAVLLLEFCGWTSKLLVKQIGNESVEGCLFAGGFTRETNATLASGRQKDLKDERNDMNCDVQHGCGESPWVGEFSADNETASPTNEDMQPSFGTSCSYEEYSKFKAFFSKFMVLARDFYLPPQRQRYGFVSDRSMLSTLDIEKSDQWSLIISYAGCPGCITKLKDEKYLQNVLEIDDGPVMELPDDGNGLGSALPIDKPSIILFVDRTSDFIETREKSEKALQLFRELALQYRKSYPMDRQGSDWPKRSLHTYQRSAGLFKNQRMLLSPTSKIKLGDRLSLMIINEGKQVNFGNEAPNLQSGSLHEIMTYLLGQKKQLKLNSLAKETGFQLLSDEIDIKVESVSSSLEQSQSQDSPSKLDEVSEETTHDMNKDYTDNVAPVDQEQQFQLTNVEASYDNSNQKGFIDHASKESGFVDPHQSLNDHKIASGPNVDLKLQTDAETEQLEGVRHQFNAFTGSFFFCDGNYKVLRSLTSNSEVPRIVIIDPLSQQHYILSEEMNHSVHSISTFIDGFLNGSLIPYQRSGPLRKSIGMPQPPYVNLDFHEKDFIPCVTTDTFSELVFGSGESAGQYATNAWHKDVIVLFSSSWCGFCQRMELIVREVYRALKGYINMVESVLSQDDLKDVISKLPVVYSIDCTLNECSGILKSMGQKEVYPSLLLFPAKRKTAIVYDGNMMVTDIIKFMANHGSSSHHLVRHKGILWIDAEEKKNHDDKFKDAFQVGDNKRSSDEKNAILQNVLQNAGVQNPLMFKLNEIAAPPNPAVGSFLVATDLLQGFPFNKAKILIVSADHEVGFQGLIINKPIISWDSLLQFQDSKPLETAPISFGGPVLQQELPLVSLTKLFFNDQCPQVLPGVYFLDQFETLSKIKQVKAGNLTPTDFWFFWGYSGWSWEQLFSEIAQGVWTLHEGNIEHLQWPT